METADQSQPVPGLSIYQRIERGRCIGRLYVAAQHLSRIASDDACRLLEEANDNWQNFGFNQILAKSPYMTRARGSMPSNAPRGPFTTREARSQLQKMTTEPWMFEVPKLLDENDTFGQRH